MAQILIIGEAVARADALALALSEKGHEVEILCDPAQARARLGNDPADIAIIEVSSTDGGPGMLVGQTKAAWPECRIIALTASRDVETSKLVEMGLWDPELTLAAPVDPAQLVRAVARLLGDNVPVQTETDGVFCA